MTDMTLDEIQDEINRLRKQVDTQKLELRVLEQEYERRIKAKEGEIEATESVVEELRRDFFKRLEKKQKEREAAGLQKQSSNYGGIQELLDTYKDVTESL